MKKYEKDAGVYIARKINIAFGKGRGFWKNVENIIFKFTSECSKINLALPLNHIIIQNAIFQGIMMYYEAYLGTRKIQIW